MAVAQGVKPAGAPGSSLARLIRAAATVEGEQTTTAPRSRKERDPMASFDYDVVIIGSGKECRRLPTAFPRSFLKESREPKE